MRWASYVPCADVLSVLCRPGRVILFRSYSWPSQRCDLLSTLSPEHPFKGLEPEGCHAVECLPAVSGARVVVALARVPTVVVIFAPSVGCSGRLRELFHKAVLPRGGQHLAYGVLVEHLVRSIARLEGTHHVPC